MLRRRGLFFFFSSRRRHTRSLRDWSSDVCSSDLCKRQRFATLGETGEEKEAGGESGKSQTRPGEKREEPGLRCAIDVHTIYVRLYRPGQPSWAMRGPEKRSRQGYQCCGEKTGEDTSIARGSDALGK